MTAEEFYQKWMAENNHVLDTLKFAEAYAKQEANHLIFEIAELKNERTLISNEKVALQKKVDELESAYNKYGQHLTRDCYTTGMCKCGFEQALNQ